MTEVVRRYQVLPESFFDIIKRRKLSWSECFLAIYLRGKAYRFGNPFYLFDSAVREEINMHPNTLSRLRRNLQIKGVIKYDTFHGRGKRSVYTMLDSYMVPVKKPTILVDRHTILGGFNDGVLSTKTHHLGVSNKKNKKEEEPFNDVLREQIHQDVQRLFNK